VAVTPRAESNAIVLEHLRPIRGAVDGLREDMREVKNRLGILENQYASLSSRIDRLDARIERIEKCLDLAEA
jgi:predicted  nucleic acid-binding Zn-ribbon protein